MKARVLIVAGSDSGGGAGIQGDLKTVTCLKGYGATAITALTAQNTQGVFSIHDVPPAFIQQQMRLVLDDIGADCIKIGMLHSRAVIDAVADVLEREAAGIPVVLDPVMIAKSGYPLLDPEAVDLLRKRLISRATLLTPNLPEAEALTGLAIKTVPEMMHAARLLATLGPEAMLIKGGHLESDKATDLLLYKDRTLEVFESERVESVHTHGTGCTLASGIATGIAQGLPLREAVVRARAYVQGAIRHAPGLGLGHGPLGHGFTVREFPAPV